MIVHTEVVGQNIQSLTANQESKINYGIQISIRKPK